jgi:hypothetical protein
MRRMTAAGLGRLRALRRVGFALAVIGALIGLQHLLFQSDVLLEDVPAYYQAGARLNAGQELYVQEVGADEAAFYRYPPLLAIAFRPLALLPYPTAAVLWEAALVAAFLLALHRLGLGYWTWIWLGILAMPIVWSLTIGQAQVLVTALLIVGAPWAVALAGHLKLLPFVVGLYWAGRRDWPRLGQFLAWVILIGLVQLALEPRGTLAYLTFPQLSQVGAPNVNWSPYGISPIAWAVFLVVGTAGVLVAARTRWGWPAAFVFSVFASPRVVTYQFMTGLAGLRRPDEDQSIEGPR